MSKGFHLSMHEAQMRMTERMQSNYMPVPESGCWIWIGRWDRQGYGEIHGDGRWTMRAHRLFFAYYVDEIPAGLIVCHKCDTPSCVNPQHLFLGTDRDNARDKHAKGRDRFSKARRKLELEKAA